MRIASKTTKTKSNINPRAKAAYQKYISGKKKSKPKQNTPTKRPTIKKPSLKGALSGVKQWSPTRIPKSNSTRPKPKPSRATPIRKKRANETRLRDKLLERRKKTSRLRRRAMASRRPNLRRR
mgnify:CR=1 FL=1|tara:strand:- start:177 stop:545 length:369 start_codon:yes stop_codon:yes gene_type:complete